MLPRLITRDVSMLGCRFRVAPGVFSPGLYFSTSILAHHILRLKVAGKAFLDMGTGSGALGILAARQGARVLAVDINPKAAATTRANAALNRVSDRVQVKASDLFEEIPNDRRFDYIIFNPPFYPVPPTNYEECAWLAGHEYQTIRRFLREAGDRLSPAGRLILLYSTEMDIPKLDRMAVEDRWLLLRKLIIPHLFEQFLICEYAPERGFSRHAPLSPSQSAVPS